MTDLRHRLWHDSSVFQARAERQAATYLAVVRSLRKHRPLDGDEEEFLALHEFVAGLPPPVVGATLGDPYARFWIALAFALLGAVLRGEELPRAARVYAAELGSDDPHDLLRAHLGEYKRLALGAAVVGGVDLELEVALEVTLPTALPAARAAIVGDPRVRIAGRRDGRLRVERGEAAIAPCPIARVDGFTVPLQPHGYAFPGLGWMPPAGRSTLDDQGSQVGLVEQGLRLVARHVPEVFAQIRQVIRWIAVNPTSEYVGTNYVSYSDLPGAFAFRGVPNPYSAAEACIHEFHHYRLFCLEEVEPLLEESGRGSHEDDAIYYSPWREEPRPIRGVLHAVYVTLAQVWFWIDVLRQGESPALSRFAVDQLIRHPLMVGLGIAQLESFAPFTPAGRRLFDELKNDVARNADTIRALGVPEDAAMLGILPDGSIGQVPGDDGSATRSLRATILQHVRDYDVRGQIPQAWLAAHARAA